MGKNPVALQLRTVDNANTLWNQQKVSLQTTERDAGNYNVLDKFRSADVYYYTPGYGNKQLWQVIKVIPSDGPVLIGEPIYFRNVEESSYLAPDGGYVGSRSEPYAWEVVLP